MFQTNPLAALYDAQVTDERNTNSDWNTIWHVKTARFGYGHLDGPALTTARSGGC